MRLINTSTGRFEEFIGREIPEYAILSHTWGEDEVSFQDMGDLSCRNKKGYEKIEMTRRIALQSKIRYVWIDTSCIDKTSSAELTEAINSMYRWYERARICYVYLSDLLPAASLDSLHQCRWFTRGWTLQELIAPDEVYFFDEAWSKRGSKLELVKALSEITRIDPGILLHSRPLSSMSVAQRMSWAAGRLTTRVEDTAYCLLGLFDVNMPLLYGEEEKAFIRLQEEIIRTIADFSIFAWRRPLSSYRTAKPAVRAFCGILAQSPIDFSECLSFRKRPHQFYHPFSVCNIGISTRFQPVAEPIPGRNAYRYIFPLDCYADENISLGVRLRKCGPDQFVREDPWNLAEYKVPLASIPPRERYLLAKLPAVDMDPALDLALSSGGDVIGHLRSYALQVQLPPEMAIYDLWPWDRFDNEDQIFFASARKDCAAIRLSIVLNPQHTGLENYLAGNRAEAMFYTLGWSSDIQCTLVNCQTFSSAIDQVQSQVTVWDHDAPQMVRELSYHDIPKSPLATFPIPGTNDSAVVTFSLALESDRSICRNKFWRAVFSVNVLNCENVPPDHHGRWSLPSRKGVDQYPVWRPLRWA